MSNSAASLAPLEVAHLLDGKWTTDLDTCGAEEIFNPSTGQVIASAPLASATGAVPFVEAATRALRDWSQVPAVERARLMFRYRALLEEHFEELARLVTREHGKTLAESRAEVQRGMEMVEFACGVPSLLTGDTLPNMAVGVDAETNRHPVGVCVGITPYNFPAMVPLWMFPIALVCGNTFILKPSEKVPLSAVRLGELLVQAGVPDGVFQIVQGGQPCVQMLLTHPGVSAVSFVGSTRVARAVYETATRNGKRVQAAGGAKNHLIVMPDADLDQATAAVAASAYGCAGQRCMAGSVAVTIGPAGNALVDRLCHHAQGLRVGPTDGIEDVDMGPLIRADHLERVSGFVAGAMDDGATLALDGRREFTGNAFLLGPCVVDHVQPAMRVAQEEIFGPVLSVVRAKDLHEALEIGSKCPFGNGASIFTGSGYAAREFKRHFNAGMIGINVGVPAPMAWFPFSGWNHSFFGDLHMQGVEGVHFYTRQKMTLSRWFATETESPHDPVWRTAGT